MKRGILIVKYGSTSVSDGYGIDRQRLNNYATGLAALHRTYELVIVSSGSVAVGRGLWNSRESDVTGEVPLRSLAMLGSGLAFTVWQESLARHGILSGQLLVTHREVDDPTEGPSLRAAVADNMSHGIVTIVNENDALSDIELAKLSYGGDNDGLAAHLALTLGACGVLLMTDVEGLQIDGLTTQVVKADEQIRSRAVEAAGNPGAYGRGGMASKVAAAAQIARGGIDAYIARAGTDLVLVLAGESGTHFVADNITK